MTTNYAVHPEAIRDAVAKVLGDKAKRMTLALGELTVVVDAAHYLEVACCATRPVASSNNWSICVASIIRLWRREP